MANPKYKMSRSNTRARRAHDSLSNPALGICPSCKAPTISHRICSSCGHYKGKDYFSAKKTEKKA